MVSSFFFICLLMILNVTSLDLSSPCPETFQYSSENNVLHGLLQVQPRPRSTLVQLQLELSVGNSVQGYNGNIELALSRDKIAEDMMSGRPILYKVFFPVWTQIPPKITKISVNGDLICTGPKIPIDMVQILTTITLQHTLRIDGTPVNTLDTNGGNLQDFPDNRYDQNPIRPESNNFNFSPPMKPLNEKEVPNPFNFKPTMPKDPTHFEGNPFFMGLDPNKNNLIDNRLARKADNPFSSGPSFAHNPFLHMNRPAMPTIIDKVEAEGPKDTKNPVPDYSKNPFLRPYVPTQDTQKPATPDLGHRQKPPIKDDAPVQPTENHRPYSEICGRPITTVDLIVLSPGQNSKVPKGAYPWLTAIYWQSTDLKYICSGSLVSNKHIVTAAHCLMRDNRKVKASELLVVLGKLNIAKWTAGPGERMIEPEFLEVHPNYDRSSDADIGIIVMSETVRFSTLISPICLWDGRTDLDLVVGNNQFGVVAGWGKDEEGRISTPEPKHIKIPIVTQETCLRSSPQFTYITSNRTFCAGFLNGTGPCNGDSGSGFIMKRGPTWRLRGIVSMSISDTNTRTCDLNNYVVFTDASKFVDWILSFLQ